MQKQLYKKHICTSEKDFEIYFKKWGKKYYSIENIFKWFCSEFKLYPFTQSKFQGRLKTIHNIWNSNKNLNIFELQNLINEYYTPDTSVTRKLDISRGENGGKKYTEKLKQKAKTKIHIGRIEYWINKGYSLEDAKIQKREYYRKLSKRAREVQISLYNSDPVLKKQHYNKIALTKQKRRDIKYWLDKGVNLEEAQKHVLKYKPPTGNIERYILKYGKKEGTKRYQDAKNKRKNTYQERYNVTTFLRPYVSKASLRYLVPVYKLLRKSGVKKDDIKWGIGKNKEFTTYDKITNKNYCFDFVVLSKKIIVEYNDTFWHARKEEEWCNPMVDYKQSYERDKNKMRVAKKLGYTIIYVWSDKLIPSQELCRQILK